LLVIENAAQVFIGTEANLFINIANELIPELQPIVVIEWREVLWHHCTGTTNLNQWILSEGSVDGSRMWQIVLRECVEGRIK